MHRQIVYSGQIPLETDQLTQNRNTMIAMGLLAQDLLGSATIASGLPCTATTPASLAVLVGAGRIYTLANVDGTAYSTLAADTTHQIVKQGILLDPVTLATPAPVTGGFSVNYLIQGIYQDVDTNLVTLPYFNSGNPQQAFSGPGGLGAQQPTQRQGQVILSAKAGVPATTGTQATPAPDAGYIGLYVVTVANGQATVTSGNIATYSGAQFLSSGPYVSSGRTNAEITAGITPTSFAYLEGVVNRYGNNTTPGTTDMTQAIKNAYLVHKAGGAPVTFLGQVYLVTDTCISIATADVKIAVQGIPLRTVILNKAPANKPTFKLTDAQIWDIRGFVFTGAATFPNVGISVETAGGQRCAFGYMRDIVCCTNGVGIHLVGCNTITIENPQYWPSGQNWGATADANALTCGILADGNTAVNGITLRNINIGNLNSIANGGCGILIDGHTSGAPYQAWEIDELECEVVSSRALWVRNVNIGSFRNLFTENAEIRLDWNCVGVAISEIEAAASGTLVMDGTTAGGGCFRTLITNSQASSFTADAANSETVQINNRWASAPGNADSSISRVQINVRTTGSVLVPDMLGGAGLAFGQSSTAQAISGPGSTIDGSASLSVARVAPTGAFTGMILAPGRSPGQQKVVVNESVAANTITFAASGTSNVADGASCVIAGLRQMTFIWDAVTALWYH